jgi:hypothetical protein
MHKRTYILSLVFIYACLALVASALQALLGLQ